MSWLDDLFAPVTTPIPQTTVTPPRPMTSYGFEPGAEADLERLVNQFASVMGVSRVVVDGTLNANDAKQVVAIQRALFADYTCDDAASKAGLTKLSAQLAAAGQLAAADKVVSVSAEQMWCSQNQDVLLDKLPAIYQGITSGQLQKCSRIPWLWIGLAVGAYALTRRKR